MVISSIFKGSMQKQKLKKKMLLEMLFADDAAVSATTEEELQAILNTFFQVFKQFGLQMAIKKLKFSSRDQNPNQISLIQ